MTPYVGPVAEALEDPPVRSALLRLAPRPSAPGFGRHSVRGILGWAPPDTIDRVELLVSELLTNSVVHAGLRPNQDVDLRLRCGGHGVRVEVADLGTPFQPDIEPQHGEPGRWGFYLMRKLADRWGVDQRGAGKAVWFEIDL